jgi:hypothetical protein
VSHADARTTFHGRLLIVQRWQAGRRKAHIAAAMGISRKCAQPLRRLFQRRSGAGGGVPHQLGMAADNSSSMARAR